MSSFLYLARPDYHRFFITAEMLYELLQLWGQTIVGLKRRTG